MSKVEEAIIANNAHQVKKILDGDKACKSDLRLLMDYYQITKSRTFLESSMLNQLGMHNEQTLYDLYNDFQDLPILVLSYAQMLEDKCYIAPELILETLKCFIDDDDQIDQPSALSEYEHKWLTIILINQLLIAGQVGRVNKLLLNSGRNVLKLRETTSLDYFLAYEMGEFDKVSDLGARLKEVLWNHEILLRFMQECESKAEEVHYRFTSVCNETQRIREGLSISVLGIDKVILIPNSLLIAALKSLGNGSISSEAKSMCSYLIKQLSN